MLKIENTQVMGWEAAIRGMRNPMNSWDRSDSDYVTDYDEYGREVSGDEYIIGPNDHKLMMDLAKGGSAHAKYRRMIVVYADITGPLYWWKEMDTYMVGKVQNSCSTMHKIHAKEFELDDFSHEHLFKDTDIIFGKDGIYSESLLKTIIGVLNMCRKNFLETGDKKYWWQMIQLLPSSYNQKRTVILNYENLSAIYHDRKDHKLDEWRQGFCPWIKTLPYSELITGEVLA